MDISSYLLGKKAGGSGTKDYSTLINKPSINGVTLEGDNSTSDLGINIPDVSNFITKTVDDLVNYYKKSETYTKNEVNSLIGAISTINILVVQTLPVQDISTTTIYLVPKSTSKTNDVYDEYIYVSNSWEKIGTTEIDLSGYQEKIDSTHKLDADLVDDTTSTNKFFSGNYNDLSNKPTIPDVSNYYTKSEIDNMIGTINSTLATMTDPSAN